MKKEYYKILDVDENASPEEIKKAHRTKAKETHPDKKNGNDVKFIKVQIAYEILSDPDKRSRYDKGEKEQPVSNSTEDAMLLIISIFNAIIDSNQENVEFDLVGLIKSNIDNHLSNVSHEIQKAKGCKKHYEKVVRKLKYKGKFQDFLRHTLEGGINKSDKTIEDNKYHLKVAKLAKKLLKDYDYEFLGSEILKWV